MLTHADRHAGSAAYTAEGDCIVWALLVVAALQSVMHRCIAVPAAGTCLNQLGVMLQSEMTGCEGVCGHVGCSTSPPDPES